MTGMIKWIAPSGRGRNRFHDSISDQGGPLSRARQRAKERERESILEDNDPELISRSFHLIDLISPGPEQVDR